MLDFTYTNGVDQTSCQTFYTLSAAENPVIYGSDVANAVAEAPPPTQDFFICPDKAFVEWWASKNQPPTPHGHVIPVKTAMQRHPESPRLWE